MLIEIENEIQCKKTINDLTNKINNDAKKRKEIITNNINILRNVIYIYFIFLYTKITNINLV